MIPANTSSHLLRLLTTGSNSDMDLITSDGTVHRLHKLLMSAASPVFAELLINHRDVDNTDGRVVIRDAVAQFDPCHIRILIASAYAVELDTFKWDRFIASSEVKTRRRLSPWQVMAIFETATCFGMPLPSWVLMHDSPHLLCNAHYHSRNHLRLGIFDQIIDCDGDTLHRELDTPAPVDINRVGQSDFTFSDDALEMINSYFKSERKIIRSFELVWGGSSGSDVHVYHYYMVRINHRNVGRVSLSLSYPPQAVVKITNLCYQWMSQ